MKLAELGHPQPQIGTPCYMDNSTAKGIPVSSMRQKISKSFDMGLYWFKERTKQNQFKLIWRKGKTNMADCFTKYHPPWHHKNMIYKYLHKALSAALTVK